MDRLQCISGKNPPIMLSLDYHRAMKILNSDIERPWELESACRWCRRAAELRDLYELNQAEANLRSVLERY